MLNLEIYPESKTSRQRLTEFLPEQEKSRTHVRDIKFAGSKKKARLQFYRYLCGPMDPLAPGLFSCPSPGHVRVYRHW